MRALLLALALAPAFDAYLAPLTAAHDLNGVVLVARGDQIVWQKAFGQADWDLNAPLTMRSRFRIASVTKTFTAAAIAMLAEQGKLAVTDPLSKYVPDFPKADKITLRMLLLHRSGVPNPESSPCSDASLGGIVSELAKQNLWFEPGTSNGYSNGGYAMLARVVELASGETWADFIANHITKTLALKETTVDTRTGIVPARARGFVPGPGASGVAHAACEGAWAAYGSGALVSTASDLHRWARAVRNETIFKRTKLEYPYGWGVRDYLGKHVIEQSGIVNGFSSYVAAYLDEDVYVVVLTNVQNGQLTDIGKGLASVAFGIEPAKLKPSPAANAITAEDRKRWLGKFKNDHIATVEIAESEGALYLRWGNAREQVYLAPTGASKAYDRQDAIALELSDDGRALAMKWPSGEPQRFERLP